MRPIEWTVGGALILLTIGVFVVMAAINFDCTPWAKTLLLGHVALGGQCQ
jgi:hypothetical protein